MEPHPSEIRRSRHREEARRAILDATEAILLEDGVELFSIRKLATRCGFTAPTIYHYFRDKDGLIDALLEERVAVLADAIEKVPVTGDAFADLHAVLRVFVGFGAAHPTFDRLMWTVSSKGESRTTPAMERLSARVRPPLVELAESQRLRDHDIETAGQMIWALLHGLSALRVIEPGHPWVPNLGERALETMLRGMTRPAPEEASHR
jgi:AcrR family transcriptional regulator